MGVKVGVESANFALSTEKNKKLDNSEEGCLC